MALNNRQKDIVNPYYKEYDYNWTSTRNQWVLAGIHDTYLNFGFFPEVGLEISFEPGIIPEGDSVTIEDIQAYVSVYPQNAEVINNSLVMVSDAEAIKKLDLISTKLLNSGLEKFYTSPTSKESQNPENQAAITGSSGVQHLIDDDLNRADVPFNVSDQDLLKQNTSQLISIPYTFSVTRRRKIRDSFGNPTTSLLEPIISTVEDQSVIPFRGQPDTIDLYNWYNNVLPGAASQAYYYNPNDEKYYFVKRTNARSKQAYDLGLSENNQETQNNISTAKEKGIEEILKLVGKFSAQNLGLFPRDEAGVRTYLDKRPSSRWVYAVTIPKSLIDGDLLEDVAQNESTQDIDFEPYQKAELLINPDKNTSLRHSTFTLSGLQESIRGTLRVLKDYENIMIAEQITPDVVSGFDIEREILKLETFYDSLSSFFLYSDITTDDDLSNRIEFVFREDMRIAYVVLDGTLYSKGFGATFLLPTSLVDQDAPLTSYKAVDVFATFGNRTFGFVFNSLLIDNVIGIQNQTERPLWDEFLSTYVIPRVKISPTTQQRKRDKKDFRINKPPNIFQKIDQLTDNPPPGDLSRMSVSQKDLYYSVTSAMGSCDSVQSTLLKEAFTIYRLINGRAPVWSLTKYAALLARDELIKEKINQERLNDVIGYAENPSRIARDAENWVNSEISCITDLIGTAIEEQILKPAGSPKEINKLITRGIVNPPLRFSFKKGFNSNLWSLWKKQIQLMLIAFIKQLILGVLKDVFKAALGCGPEDPFNTAAGLADSRKGINYGRIMLNDLIRGIDVVEIASDLSLTNKQVSYNENKDRRITTSPPHQDQLLQLHRDVSTIVTPTELGRLLDGTASEVLINTLDEMINAGEVDTQALFGERSEIEWDDKIVVSMYQESLSPRTGAESPYDEPDVRYAILGFNKDNIVNYFREIGNQLSEGAREALYGEDPITAIQSYCDDREATPPDLRWEFDLSDIQKQEQAQEAVNSKRLELISLCAMMEGKFNFQLELEDFLGSIPNAGIYDAILRWIAALSNAAMEGLMNLFTEDPVVEQPRSPVLLRTPMGQSLLQQQKEFGLWARPFPRAVRNMPDLNEEVPFPTRDYFTVNVYNPPGWNLLEDGVNFTEYGGRAYLDMPDISLILGEEGYRFEKVTNFGQTRETLAESLLSARNNPDGHSLIFDRLKAKKLPSLPANLYNSTLASYQNNDTDRRIVPAGNTTENVYGIISDFYFTPLARTRLPAAIRSFITPYFKANDDDCITTQDEAIAKAFMTSIEARVSKFFLNVGPLFRTYFYWNTVDTINAISTYMFNKISNDLKEKGLYGAYIQNVDKVLEVFGLLNEQAYSRATSGLGSYNNEKILYTDDLNATEKLYEVIKQSIFLVINRQADTDFPQVAENFYDNQEAYRGMGSELLSQLKEDIIAQIQNQPTVGPRGLVPSEPTVFPDLATEEQIEYIIGNDQNNFDAIMAHTPQDWYRHDVQYYLPVPLFTAMHIIYFDHQVDLTTRYPKYEFETNSRIGIADDAFLTAINPTSLPQFSVPYTGFPITALGETYYSMEQLEARVESEIIKCQIANQDLAQLDEILDAIADQRRIIRNKIQEGDSLFDEISREAGVADDAGLLFANFSLLVIPGIGGVAAAAMALAWPVLFANAAIDPDYQGTSGNARYVQGWWNWIKRTVLYGGDLNNPEETGLDLNHILTTSYNDNFLDYPVVKWDRPGLDERMEIGTAAFISSLGEAVEVQEKMVILAGSVYDVAQEYQKYLNLVRKLIEKDFAQISADNWIDTHLDLGIDPPYEFEIEVDGRNYDTLVPYDEENLENNAKAKLPNRNLYIVQCQEAELVTEMLENIKEQQRIFAEARST